MKYRDDFEAIAPHPVRDDVGGTRDDKFPSVGDAARSAEAGQLGEALYRLEQRGGNSIGGPWIVARDKGAKMSQVVYGARRPDNCHTRGAFRSRLPPHDRSQLATALCGTPRPASSSLPLD